MEDPGIPDTRLEVAMKFDAIMPPREFSVGRAGEITMKDCGRVRLDTEEQVTFVTGAGAEFDVVRKAWGFYATPSINGRLKRFGWKTALVRSADAKAYVLLVESGYEKQFGEYLASEGHHLVCWLDDDVVLDRIERMTAET